MDAIAIRIAAALAPHLGLEPEEVAGLLEVPREAGRGDYAVPCFSLARRLRRAPAQIAAEAAAAASAAIAPGGLVRAVQAVGPYLNLWLEPATFAEAVLSEVALHGRQYGESRRGAGQRVVIDYSSPNIAKRFHIGHLRSTVIGAALVRLHRAQGYEVIGVNHLGDWGTQFGHLIAAWERWGEEERLAGDDPIGYLQELYVRHNRAAAEDPAYAERARAAFKRLEDGDPSARALWSRFRELSLREFARIYELLGVEFEQIAGESFYEDKIPHALELCAARGVSEWSEGALIIDFARHGHPGLPPMLLRRSDGATLYATRDLAAAIYRFETYDPAKILYVIGAPQKLHLEQLFTALRLLGFPAERCAHVAFGHVQGMSTREGTAILLDEVLGRAIRLAEERIRAGEVRVPAEQIERTARAVGVGAVVFADLRHRHLKDIAFDWDRIVRFEGETGPYLQYAHARLCSIAEQVAAVDPEAAAALVEFGREPLAPAQVGALLGAGRPIEPQLLVEPETFAVLRLVGAYPRTLERAAAELEPSVLAQYLLELAGAFSGFYHAHHVKNAEPAQRRARLALVHAVRHVLAHGLTLLGIEPLERM
ncbi:MAG: arginine--tRNA ligase [Planctomycetota bacterium]|nr:MAG: arginine--tRNA ligase [Planctomycetota bacterium]